MVQDSVETKKSQRKFQLYDAILFPSHIAHWRTLLVQVTYIFGTVLHLIKYHKLVFFDSNAIKKSNCIVLCNTHQSASAVIVKVYL